MASLLILNLTVATGTLLSVIRLVAVAHTKVPVGQIGARVGSNRSYFNPSRSYWSYTVVNPRRMREDYGSRSVCLSFCHSVILSVPALAATYLVYKCQLRCCRVPYGVANVCIVWVSQKNALFKRYGVICLPRGLSTLSADRRLTNGSGQD